MPDNGRFSEEEIEQRLSDLGARVEYPPTPDVASTVRLKLDEEEQPLESSRNLRWPPFLAPRWTAVAAALVLITVLALSPTLRTTLSDLFVPGPQNGSEAGSAAKPESGGSEDRYNQGAGVASQAAGAPAAGEGEAATACPSPSIEVAPARAAAGARFRLLGHNLVPAATRSHPRAMSRSTSGKAAISGSSRPSTPTALWHSTPGCAYQRMPGRGRPPCWRTPVPANAWRRVSWFSDKVQY